MQGFTCAFVGCRGLQTLCAADRQQRTGSCRALQPCSPCVCCAVTRKDMGMYAASPPPTPPAPVLPAPVTPRHPPRRNAPVQPTACCLLFCQPLSWPSALWRLGLAAERLPSLSAVLTDRLRPAVQRSANNKTGTTKLAAARGRKLGLLHGHVTRSFCAGGAPGGRPSRGVGLSSLQQARAESESGHRSAAMRACAALREASAGGCVLMDSCEDRAPL